MNGWTSYLAAYSHDSHVSDLTRSSLLSSGTGEPSEHSGPHVRTLWQSGPHSPMGRSRVPGHAHPYATSAYLDSHPSPSSAPYHPGRYVE